MDRWLKNSEKYCTKRFNVYSSAYTLISAVMIGGEGYVDNPVVQPVEGQDYIFKVSFTSCGEKENLYYLVAIEDDEWKVDNLLDSKPKRGAYFTYLYENDSPKYTYQNNGEIDLLGSIIYKVNDKLRFSFSSGDNRLNYAVEIFENDSYLERIVIESNGEMISGIIHTKNNDKFYRVECHILYDLLEEITFDEKMTMYSVRSVHKILRSDAEIKRSKEESKISLSDEYIALLKQAGFKEDK